MSRLYWIFVQGSLRGIVAGLSLGIFVITIVERVGAPPMRGLGLAVSLLIYGLVLFNLFQLPRNLSWTLLLPISKRKLVLTHILLTVTNSLLTLGAAACLVVYAIESTDIVKFVRELTDSVPLSPAGSAGVSSLPPSEADRSTLMPWVYFSVAGVGFVSYMINSLALAAGLSNQRKQSELWDSRRTIRLVGLLGLTALAALFLRPILDNGFVYYMIGLTATAVLFTRHTTFVLGLPKIERRRWIGAGATIVLFLSLGTFIHARSLIQSSDSDQLVEAVRFMGPWGGKVDAKALSAILKRPLSPGDFENAVTLLDESTPGNGLQLDPNGKDGLLFEEVISVQKNDKTLRKVPGIFRINKMNLEHLLVYLDHHQKLLPNLAFDYVANVISPVLRIPLRRGEIERLFKRKDRLTRYFLVIRERIYQEGWTLRWLARELRHWNVSERQEAWATLSILLDRPMDGLNSSVDGLIQIRMPASRSPAQGCQGLSLQSDRLYSCLWRNYFRLSSQHREYLYWSPSFFEAPFDKIRTRRINQILKELQK